MLISHSLSLSRMDCSSWSSLSVRFSKYSKARAILCQGFDRLGIRYHPSRANFVLFQVGDRSIAIRDALRDRGVLVRDRSYEIPGCVRVTAGTPTQAERFLTELEAVWKK